MQTPLQIVWEQAVPVARRIAANYARRYPWIDADDLSQSMLLKVPSILNKFNPTKATKWSTYLYLRLFMTAKDCLREEDPLGIGYPTRKPYPEWRRLNDGEELPKHHSDDEELWVREFVAFVNENVPDPEIYIRHVLHKESMTRLAKSFPITKVRESIRVGNEVCVIFIEDFENGKVITNPVS